MGKISDEIRKWCEDDGEGAMRTIKQLYTLADRVDREMVELPLDRDGVPIHVGDTVYLEDGRMAEAYSIKFKNCETNVLCRTPSGCYGYVYRLPNKLTHNCPDSFGRIADDMDNFADANYASGLLKQGIKDFADRIRKLAKEQTNE